MEEPPRITNGDRVHEAYIEEEKSVMKNIAKNRADIMRSLIGEIKQFEDKTYFMSDDWGTRFKIGCWDSKTMRLSGVTNAFKPLK